MTIKVHHLRPAPGAKTAKTRVGRGEGGKGGKTAGRGTKGTKARKNVSPAFEGGQMPIHMRLPKLKGFRNRFRTEYEVVNVGDINRLFPKGGDIGIDELVAAGAVRKKSLVKVLGDGKLSVKVNVTAHKFSGSAREKITSAGVLLPMSQTALDSERFGTRHRAAIGISEQTDAVVVVVSEETGSISLVVRGRIERNLTEEQLRRRIFNLIRPQAPRTAVPFLRRSVDGRWQIGRGEPGREPVDPDARIVSGATDHGAVRR